ncbi:MAG: MATE family efflux transporter [Ruminococcaceae bacterium]|nr:MATE family efflux transporter [Oscillospiraceae bacterium]
MKENKMGTMPVHRLLVTMSLPIIVSMLVQALYNNVDSFFISQIKNTGREGLTAVSQAFSAQNLMIGIATGTGVGVNALLSRALGQGDRKKANKIASTGILLAFFGYTLILLFGLFGTDLYFRGILSTATFDDKLNLELVRQFGNDYLRICCIGSLGVFMQIMFERLMQATGRTVFTLFTQGLGAVINIILDPIFIFEEYEILGISISGLGLGAAGAAWATIIGQFAAALIGFALNAIYNKDVKLSFADMRPDFPIIREIYSIGVPSIVMVSIGSIMFYVMNIIIMGVSSVGATIFGVYYKLQSITFMPVFGMNNAVIPIIGYNYGAGNRKRMQKAIRIATIYVCAFMFIGLLLMQFIPKTLLGIFESDPAILDMGATALRTISLSFVFAGVCIALGSMFQALGKGTYSLIVSVARQLIVLVPVAFLLSLSGNLSLIWLAFPIAEVASLAVTLVMYRRINKKIISKLPDGN